MKKTALYGLLGALALAPAITSAASVSHSRHSTVVITEHDGDDDLATAGLGRSGLESPEEPAIADPLAPTPAELRRLNIWANYRALVDTTDGGGFGRLFGPNLDLDGNDTLGEGLIPGTEYRTSRNVRDAKNVTLLV